MLWEYSVAIASWPFWLFLATFICWEMYEVERAKDAGIATILLILFVVLTFAFTDLRPWNYISLEMAIIYVAAYLAIGVLYMMLRYWIFLNDEFKAFQPTYNDLKDKFSKGKESLSWQHEWDDATTFKEALRASHHMPPYPWDKGVKGKIYLWMAYWPFSAAWVMGHRPLEWLYDWIYLNIKMKLKNMADRTFSKYFPE